jgi:hypothetical protein
MQTASAPIQPRVVSVHSLVEFVLQAGDITAGGFQKRDRAQAGTQGYQRVQNTAELKDQLRRFWSQPQVAARQACRLGEAEHPAIGAVTVQPC